MYLQYLFVAIIYTVSAILTSSGYVYINICVSNIVSEM